MPLQLLQYTERNTQALYVKRFGIFEYYYNKRYILLKGMTIGGTYCIFTLKLTSQLQNEKERGGIPRLNIFM